MSFVSRRFHNTDELKAHYKSIHSSPLSDVKMAGHDGQNGLLGTNMERGDGQEVCHICDPADGSIE